MRVSTKGQVTIPKEMRDRIGIKAGSEVEFAVEGDVITVRRAERRQRPGPTRGEKLVESISGTATRHLGLSTDELMKLLRGDD